MNPAAFEYTLAVGGEAGQGMQTLGVLLVRAFLRAGHCISTLQSYQNRIRGGHNYYQIRLSSASVHSMIRPIDLLLALDAGTLGEHLTELSPRAIVMYDEGKIAPPEITAKKLGLKIYDLFPDAREKEVFANSVYLGAIAGVLGQEPEAIRRSLKSALESKGADILGRNIAAFNAGYEHIRNRPEWHNHFPAPAPPEPKPYLAVSGNESLALGIIASGCKFYTAYPMTPASGVLESLAEYQTVSGMVVEQAEDEIAALNMVQGASFTGVRAMTGTSGGGFALMAEALSLSGMMENPAVILVGQRPGPATGLPTRTEQGDLGFAVHAGHGEFPRAVLAPGHPDQCFHLATHAFNLADQYQIPVLILTDQYLADLFGNVAPFDLARIKIERGKVVGAAADYRRYAPSEDGISPRAYPGKGPGIVIADSDEHAEDGHLTEDLQVRVRMVEKRLKKNEGLLGEWIPPEIVGTDKDNLVLCWGSNYGVCLDAVGRLRESGHKVSMAHFPQVWPLPGEKLSRLLAGYGNLIMVENNATGQFARLLRGETSLAIERKILKYDGLPFYCDELTEQLKKQLREGFTMKSDSPRKRRR